jgi:hypothetical protein
MDYSEITLRINQKLHEYLKLILKHDFKAAYETAKDIGVLAGLLELTTKDMK